jgi:hypothetical protein
MGPTPEELKKASQAKASQATAKGATTTISKARAGAAAAAKPAASMSTSSTAVATTTIPNKNDLKTDAPPEWKALRAQVAQNSAKVKGNRSPRI